MALIDFSDEELAEIYRRSRITANRLGGKSPDFCITCSEIKKPRDWIDFVEGQSDDFYYGQLIEAPFFGGMKATTVEKHLGAIHRHLDGFRKTAQFEEKDIKNVLYDPEMISNRKKVEAAVENAKTFSEIVDDYGSFGRFISSYGFYRSHENLLWLHGDIMKLFRHFGSTNAWFYLMIIGLPTLKPDVHVKQIFHRIGLIENEDDVEGAIEAGLRIAYAAKVPLSWVDVFAALGLSSYYYPKSDVCGGEPDCNREKNPCDIRELCKYYRDHYR